MDSPLDASSVKAAKAVTSKLYRLPTPHPLELEVDRARLESQWNDMPALAKRLLKHHNHSNSSSFNPSKNIASAVPLAHVILAQFELSRRHTPEAVVSLRTALDADPGYEVCVCVCVCLWCVFVCVFACLSGCMCVCL